MSRPVSTVDGGDGLVITRLRLDAALEVVLMCGELDLASRESARQACLAGDQVDVVVDLAGLAFMDCAGYGALVAAQVELAKGGRSMVLMDPVGEPLRLLTLLDRVVRRERAGNTAAPLEWHISTSPS